MARKFTEKKLVVATHNEGKLKEIRSLLEPFGVETVSAGELGLDVPEETGTTFAENAGIKSRAAAEASGLPALADDSGLSVDALDGAPGVYTADWAETPDGRDFAMAMETVWTRLQETGAAAPHTARFNACLSLVWPDGQEEIVHGITEGQIVWPPRGPHGFGYDPVFQPEGESQTFGEMRAEEKKVMSHRARAFRLLVEKCFEGDA